ncbi:TPA: phosphodiesterase [Vibrio parahaemolyticus]|uniref:putative bifunctional diguanylate cyclase/phosphodiesterase n=1 Tax=Vibrio parahaemolyticus TaxID=670 RepID=UPI001120B5D5|nr:phosphodiesterase [Vibrio parahaemolyticus]EGR1275370.1 phosphodiesterase [Vibrio parahaemolyticus]EHZ2723056.1 phosphodiesterase [Vibrio parahaemolyticus]EIO4604147.1 phosphodiesterase [Vibrio parahaemolyticus]EIV1595785.1 phosphodiesterase [Vibrio parahaemolyticus]EJG2371841.1 phosphodiesterase [Vibrio parahaemolyticus]
MKQNPYSSAKFVLHYFVFASLWVLFSDKAVELLSGGLRVYSLAQSLKGVLFVVITSLMLWILIKRNNREFERANDIDYVTGLHSPFVFFRYLEQILSNVSESEHYVLFLLDIDNFKPASDQLGFEKSSLFLKDIAQSIDSPTVFPIFSSRIHTDGFACLIRVHDENQIDMHLARIQRQFNKHSQHYGIDVTCSIGVALSPIDGISVKQLMSSAKFALTQAKKTKNAIRYHDKKLAEQDFQRQEMINDLRNAIKEEQIQIVFQPKYALRGKRVTGVEVLSRWKHQQYGDISPALFIKLAEENNLCSALTALVMKQASKQLKEARLLGHGVPSVSVNISATELNSVEDMYQIETYLKQDPEFARYLCLEITETAMLKNIEQCAKLVKKLKQYGVVFSIDDFGVGYTSFEIFNKLEVDEIKIDQSFIKDIAHNYRSRAITSGIIDIAKGFGIQIVAEGVETPQQLRILEELNCKQAQGFFLSRPVPITILNENILKDEEQLNPILGVNSSLHNREC